MWRKEASWKEMQTQRGAPCVVEIYEACCRPFYIFATSLSPSHCRPALSKDRKPDNTESIDEALAKSNLKKAVRAIGTSDLSDEVSHSFALSIALYCFACCEES